jgi:hypothetical protein
VTAVTGSVSDCGMPRAAVPARSAIDRIALIARSVPASSHIPRINKLPSSRGNGQLHGHDGRTHFTLQSDRSPGHPVDVLLSARRWAGAATPTR